VEVPQGKAAIAKYASDLTHLQTSGLGPCIAVSIYDPKTQIGALTHIGYDPNTSDLEAMVNKMIAAGCQRDRLQARIVGGLTNISDWLFEHSSEVLKSCGVKIVETYVGGNRPSAVQLDLKTGGITEYQERMHFNDPDHRYGELNTSPNIASEHLIIEDLTNK
jgi:chemotaxis receptor (MCP) glutamine deamidase CheD